MKTLSLRNIPYGRATLYYWIKR